MLRSKVCVTFVRFTGAATALTLQSLATPGVGVSRETGPSLHAKTTKHFLSLSEAIGAALEFEQSTVAHSTPPPFQILYICVYHTVYHTQII